MTGLTLEYLLFNIIKHCSTNIPVCIIVMLHSYQAMLASVPSPFLSSATPASPHPLHLSLAHLQSLDPVL